MASDIVILALAVAVVVLLYLYKRLYEESKRLSLLAEGLAFDKKSLSVKYGKMAEQFIPFLETYPYNKENFRFIGNPVDGIQFEDDKIVFIEFKTGNSKLSKKQENIKSLVESKRVEFREIRIE